LTFRSPLGGGLFFWGGFFFWFFGGFFFLWGGGWGGFAALCLAVNYALLRNREPCRCVPDVCRLTVIVSLRCVRESNVSLKRRAGDRLRIPILGFPPKTCTPLSFPLQRALLLYAGGKSSSRSFSSRSMAMRGGRAPPHRFPFPLPRPHQMR